MQYLNNTDQTFIRYCNNLDIPFNDLTVDYKLISHLLKKQNNLEYNKSLLELFRKINSSDNMTIYNNIIDYIVDILIKNFLAAKNDKLFPNDMFSYDIIKYLIDNDRFFEKMYHNDEYSLFDIILLSKDTIQYFNFKLPVDYFEEYINIGKEYYNQLNTLVYGYDTIKATDLIPYYNYIDIITNIFVNNPDIDDNTYSQLYDNHFNLYTHLLNTLLDCIKLNNRLLESSPYLSDSITYTDLLKFEQNNLGSMISKIISYSNPFFKRICEIIVNNNFIESTKSYTSLISIIPCLLNTQLNRVFKMDNDIFIRLNNIITENIGYIIDNNDINIHDKVKYIRDGNIEWFQEKKVYISLVRLYREIEKYSENNGFQDKTKARFSIINILNKCKNIEWFDEIKDSDINDFFTLLIYEFNTSISSLVIHKKNYENMITHNYIYLYRDRYIVLKYKLTLDIEQINKLYKFISKFIKRKVIFSLNTTLSKLCELYSNLFVSSYMNNLYLFSDIFRRNTDNNEVDSQYTIYDTMLTEFYSNVFTDFYELTTNDNFIKFHINNIEYYNEKCLIDSSNKFKYLTVNIGNSIKMTIAEIFKIFINKINECKSFGEQYICDIPNEFLDPIMMCPIINPVEIPETQYMLEESVIMNHLVFSETNPFTRSKLTKDILLEYNNCDDVKNRRELFIKNFNKWKEDNKIELNKGVI